MFMKTKIPINAYRGGRVSATILSGYYKFGSATILRNYNGVTAIIEIDDEEDKDTLH